MPMGISTQDLKGMSIPALEELHHIATEMVKLTTLGEQYKIEYGQLAAEVDAEIKRKKMEIETKRQLEQKKIEQAKQQLISEKVDIQANLELFGDQSLIQFADLIEAYETISTKHEYLAKKPPKSVKKSQLPSKKLMDEFETAKGNYEKELEAIRKVIKKKIDDIEEQRRIALTVAIPAQLSVEGYRNHGTYIYPSGGTIKPSPSVTYQLHPNRTLVHVKDEIPTNATPALAGKYLAAVVKGCLDFIASGAWDGKKQRVNGVLPSGRTFFWIMIGEKFDKNSMKGYAGQIRHIDSGYENSPWHGET